MNTMSECRTEAPANEEQSRKILVWDAPVRVFHWLMVLSFAGAYLTAESERWQLLHVTLGYTMAGLVVFRIFWGLVGTRYARFSSFVRSPAEVGRYLKGLFSGRAERHAGHNPAGAIAILALLGLALGVAITGWALYNDAGGHWLEEVHEAMASIMLAVVGVHVAGVLISSLLHRENLVSAMIGGRKQGSPQESISSAWRSVAALMLVAVLGFWFWQWQGAPAGGFVDVPATSAHGGHDRRGDHDSDDD